MRRFLLRTPVILLPALLLILLAGCGKKGPVQPLTAVAPEAPRELQIRQQGDDFLLSWQAPLRNRDGSPADDIGSFRVYREDYAADEACPSCRQPQQLVASIDLRDPRAVQKLGGRYFWRDRSLTIGRGYAYQVVALTDGERPGDAADGHRVCRVPPLAPNRLEAKVRQGQVMLSWQPSASLPEGAAIVGYNLYRSRAGERGPLVPVNASPLKGNSLTDRSLEANRRYEYRISTLVRFGRQQVESPLSETAQVTVSAE